VFKVVVSNCRKVRGCSKIRLASLGFIVSLTTYITNISDNIYNILFITFKTNNIGLSYIILEKDITRDFKYALRIIVLKLTITSTVLAT